MIEIQESLQKCESCEQSDFSTGYTANPTNESVEAIQCPFYAFSVRSLLSNTLKQLFELYKVPLKQVQGKRCSWQSI